MTFKPWLISNDPILEPFVCENIIEKFKGKGQMGQVSKDNKNMIDTSIRSVQGLSITKDDSSKLYDIVKTQALAANNRYWGFSIPDMDPLQFLEYHDGSHYDWHLDIGPGSSEHRKLSIIIPLSDPKSYNGGRLHLKIGPKNVSVDLKQGHAIFFPSYILHKVTPVTKGKRFMLVGWMKGKTPFR
jgi:predicted 2-oxoglutarate/Fe(II)-dependent dioxygenase YbiX